MQTSIYYTNNDNWLLQKVEEKGRAERRSRSAVILRILEEYFTRNKRLGEILCQMGCITHKQLEASLQQQKEGSRSVPLGRILLNQEAVSEHDLGRALALQGNHQLN